MLHISDNLKFLRNRKSQTQAAAAEGMGIPRDRYRKYEDGTNTPPAEMLLQISRYYHISIDLLLTVDLRKTPVDNLLTLEDNRIVLPIQVDRDGNDIIEIVPHKARAGYLTGYADHEFISQLPQVSFPNLSTGKHRAFPISGDSMPPHNDTSYIVGKYIENLGELRIGKTYILVTSSEGIVYKRLAKRNDDALEVKSDNRIYAPYKVKLSDILEIWEFAGSMNSKEADPDDLDNVNVKDVLMGLRSDIAALAK